MRGNASAARGRFQLAGQYCRSDHPCRDSGFVQQSLATDGGGRRGVVPVQAVVERPPPPLKHGVRRFCAHPDFERFWHRH